MIFSKANLMVGKIASQSETDRGINCIHLNPDGSTVAANGRVMMAVGPTDPARTHFPAVGELAKPPALGVSISLDMLDKVIKNLPKGQPKLQNVAMTKPRDEGKVELTTSDMRHEQRIAGPLQQDPFPNWKNIFRRVRGGFKVCFNRKDLIDLLAAMEEACPDKGGENPVFLEVKEDGTGMVIRCTNRETGQRAVGAITAYKTDGHWLPADNWEKGVFEVVVKSLVRRDTGNQGNPHNNE